MTAALIDLIELETLDAAGQTARALFSEHPLRPFSHFDPHRPDAAVAPRIAEMPTFGQDLYVDPDRMAGDVAIGSLALDDTDGALAWLRLHTPVSLTWRRGVDGAPFAAWNIVAAARFLPPRWRAGVGNDGILAVITIYDRRLDLDQAVQAAVMAGDAVGDAGLGGSPDLKDQPLPLALGDLSTANISAPIANQSRQIWRVHDGGAGALSAVHTLYYRGGAAGLTDAGDLGAGLETATLSAGQYARDMSRGLVRLGGNISGDLTMDVTGPTGAGTTAPALIKWALQRRYAGAASLGAAFDAPAALSTASVGTYVTEGGASYAGLIDDWCRSAGLWCVPDEAGVWRIGAHAVPTATADIVINDHAIVDIEADEVDPPAAGVTVLWGRNYTPAGRSQIAESVYGTTRESWLATEWRRETYPAAAGQAAVKARWPGAKVREVSTDLRYQADAAALAARLHGLLGPRADMTARDGWRVAVSLDRFQGVKLGMTAQLIWNEAGIDRRYVVLGRRLGSPEPHLMWLRLWG